MQVHAPILAAAKPIPATKFRPGFAAAALVAGKPVGSNPEPNAEIGLLSPATSGLHRPETTKQQFP
jgi:hypothetical protein